MKIHVALHIACRCGGPLIKGECGNCDAMAFRCSHCGIMIETCDCYGGPQSAEGCHIKTTTTITIPDCDCPDCEGQKGTKTKKLRGIVGDFDSRMN